MRPQTLFFIALHFNVYYKNKKSLITVEAIKLLNHAKQPDLVCRAEQRQHNNFLSQYQIIPVN